MHVAFLAIPAPVMLVQTLGPSVVIQFSINPHMFLNLLGARKLVYPRFHANA